MGTTATVNRDTKWAINSLAGFGMRYTKDVWDRDEMMAEFGYDEDDTSAVGYVCITLTDDSREMLELVLEYLNNGGKIDDNTAEDIAGVLAADLEDIDDEYPQEGQDDEWYLRDDNNDDMDLITEIIELLS